MIVGVFSARSDCTARMTSSIVSPGMKRDTSGRIALLARTMCSIRLFCDAHSREDLSSCVDTIDGSGSGDEAEDTVSKRYVRMCNNPTKSLTNWTESLILRGFKRFHLIINRGHHEEART